MISVILGSIIQILLMSPLLIWGMQKNKGSELKPLFYAAAIFIVTNLLLQSFINIQFFEGQHWNWVGKGLAIIAGLLFIAITPSVNRFNTGINTKPEWTGCKLLLTFCFSYFLIRVCLYFMSEDATFNINAETVIYQATLPGIQEELIYRGILLGLLNSMFLHPRFQFLKVNFGLAAIITSLLFGLAHSVNIHENLNFSFNYFELCRASFDGFIFALLAEKTKSIFPSIIFHNILNLIGLH